jgi:hypothetical protein
VTESASERVLFFVVELGAASGGWSYLLFWEFLVCFEGGNGRCECGVVLPFVLGVFVLF